MGGDGVAVFGLELIPSNFDPELRKYIPMNADVSKGAAQVYEILGDVFIAVIGLHVVGALKHHFVDRDGTRKRMLGKAV